MVLSSMRETLSTGETPGLQSPCREGAEVVLLAMAPQGGLSDLVDRLQSPQNSMSLVA